MDLLYSLLKVVSMIATGAFGALGLLTKYKDEEGKITPWGKVAIGGIAISSGISLTLYALETSKAKEAAIKATMEAETTRGKLETILVNAQTTAEQQKRSLEETRILKSGLEETLKRSDIIAKGMEESLAGQQSVLGGNKKILTGVTDAVQKQGEMLGLATTTLQDTERLLHPIDTLQLSIHLTIPLDTPSLPRYVSRISSKLDPFFNFLEPIGNWTDEGKRGLSAIGLNTPMPGGIGIPKNSEFYPSARADGRASDIVSVMWIELAFYRKPIDPTNFNPFDYRSDQPNQADIRAKLISSQKVAHPIQLHYFGSKEDLQIRGDLDSDAEEWMLSGNLLSIKDLAQGQLFISLGPLGRMTANDSMDWFPERQNFYFSNLYLRISKRMFPIKGTELRQYRTSAGAPYWCYRFR